MMSCTVVAHVEIARVIAVAALPCARSVSVLASPRESMSRDVNLVGGVWRARLMSIGDCCDVIIQCGDRD